MAASGAFAEDDPAGRESAGYADRVPLRVDEDNVNREAHSEGMNGAATGEEKRPAIGRIGPESEAPSAPQEGPGNDDVHRRAKTGPGLHSSP